MTSLISSQKITLLLMLVLGVFLFATATDVFAQPNNPQPPGYTFDNPLGQSTVEGVLGQVLDTLRNIVAILAILFIVIGGILYITSAGDQTRVQLAKGAVTFAIVGLAIAVAAPTFLNEVYLAVGGTPPATGGSAGALTLSEIALNVLQLLLGVIGTLAILMLVIGGILYMTSAGDQNRIDIAKKTIQFSIIGIVIALLALVIVRAIATTLA